MDSSVEQIVHRPMTHHQVSTLAGASSHRERVIYLWGPDTALSEDLVEGFKASYRRSWTLTPDNVSSVDSIEDLIREMNSAAVGARGVRFVVVRDAHRVLRGPRVETVLARWEYEARNPRMFMVLVGEEPSDQVRAWLEERKVFGRFGEPTMTGVGKWLAARASGQWRYHRLWRQGWFQPEWGIPYMDHVGWSYSAALQGLRSAGVYEPYGRRLEEILSVVPPVIHAGYVDALTLKGRKSAAVRMGRGVLAAEIPKVLGALRYRLRIYGAARALGAELYSDREIAEKLEIEMWWWRDRFKEAYPNYTEARIRQRLRAIAEAETMFRSGVSTGVLEYVAVRW